MNKFETVNNIEEEERQYGFVELLKEYVIKFEEENKRKPEACVETFGCQMNARDSEKLLGILLSAGFTESENENADIVVLFVYLFI